MGYIYLIHYTRPISQGHTTQHYLGYADCLSSRLAAHRAGNGEAPRLSQVAKQRGIKIFMVRAWVGTRADERRMKDHHNGRLLCPWCNARIKKSKSLVEVTPGNEHQPPADAGNSWGG